MNPRVVVDTSVFVAALIGPGGPSREVLRRCLTGRYRPVLGNALIAEYEDVVGRDEILERCPVARTDVRDLLEAFCSVADWTPVYFLLRPNLPDEADNHVVELACAGNARWLVTNNLRDFARAELMIPGISVASPERLLQEQ